MTLSVVPRNRPRLVCLPAAGTTSAMFADLNRHLRASTKLDLIDLPGRGATYHEDFITDMASAVDHVAPIVKGEPDSEYAIFGYSMGALIAFALTYQLARISAPLPAVLILAAARGPQVPAREKPIHQMKDAKLLKEITRYQGTTQEALDDPELMSLILPRLRADFALCETYQVDNNHKVSVPIHAMGGRSDPTITCDDLAAWLDLTTAGGTFDTLPGGHFFIHEQVQPLAAWIRGILNDTFGPAPRPLKMGKHG